MTNDHNLVSGTFLKEMSDKLTDLKNGEGGKKSNAPTLATVFYNYQTMSADILNTIGRATFEEDSWARTFGRSTAMVLPASSSLLVELNSDGTVKGKFNDTLITLRGCTKPESCQLELF